MTSALHSVQISSAVQKNFVRRRNKFALRTKFFSSTDEIQSLYGSSRRQQFFFTQICADIRRKTKPLAHNKPRRGGRQKKSETKNLFCVFQRFLREITTPFPSERNYQKLFQKKIIFESFALFAFFRDKKDSRPIWVVTQTAVFSRRYAQIYADMLRHWHTTNPEGVADFRQGCSAAKPLQTTTYTVNPEGVADKKNLKRKIFSAYFSDFCVKYHLLPVFRQSQ